ncbi:MAG: hypothetical protein Q8M92_06655 [Candidatus Subteraquimicrobiales bacterium]|nr:hypothetical protein [Candidatus Subteraquimicrobiales bacterium]
MDLNMKIDTTKIKDFMATKKGKAIVSGGLVLVTLLIIGAVLLFFFRSQPAEPPLQVTQPPASVPAQPEEEAEEEIPLPEIATEEEVIVLYIYRNPFEQPAMYAAPTAEETPTPGEEEPLPLSLDDIYTEGGVEYAVIRYGDTVYTVTEGERIGDSPYQVQAISTNYVDLLRGDEEVIRLYLGEVLVK